MSEMVERVARSLATGMFADSRAREWDIHRWGKEVDVDFIALARGAIAAMREPTAAMSEARAIDLCTRPELIGHAAHRSNWPKWDDAGLLQPELKGAATHAHRAMIDAALS